jgi:hypothetical protein
MADEVLAVEARLKDYISGSLQTLEANIGKFSRTTEQASGKTGDFDRVFAQLARRLAPAAIAATGFAVAMNTVRQSIDFASRLSNFSAKTGLSTDSIQRLGYVSKLVGVDITSMGMGFKQFQIRVYEAQQGNDKASQSFKRLGLDVKNGKTSVEDAILALSDIKDANERAALATDIFGRASIDLLPILSQGREQLQKNLQDTEKFGQVIDAETVKKLDDLGNAFGRLKGAMGGAGAEMTATMEPALSRIVSLATEGAVALKNFFKETKNIPTETRAPSATSMGLLSQTLSVQGDVLTPEAKAAMEESKKAALAEAANQKKKLTEEEQQALEKQHWEAYKIMLQENAEWEQSVKDELARQDIEREKNITEQMRVEKENQFADARATVEKRIKLEQDAAKIEQAKFDFKKDLTLSFITISGQATQNMAENARARKRWALVETVAYGGASSAIAWKEAFMAKDTGGFYGKLAAAIIGTVAAVANTAVAISTINKYAVGTRNAPGGPALVGEAGAELVLGPSFGNLPRGSTVFNNSETNSILNSGNKTEVYNFYDQSGNLIDSIRREIRSGRGQDLVSDLQTRFKKG